MKLSLTNPFEAFHGTYKTTDLVFARNAYSGEMYAYARPQHTITNTSEQRKAQLVTEYAAKVWTELSVEARAEWQKFTLQFACVPKRRRALDVCREAQRQRLQLGLEPTLTAPRFGFPAPVTLATLVQSDAHDEFRFIIEHAVETPEPYAVQVKITKPMKTVACTPREKDTSYICGIGPYSAAPLPASGQVVCFTEARFAVKPGERFGVVFRIVRIEDGLTSPVAFFDMVRPGEPAGAAVEDAQASSTGADSAQAAATQAQTKQAPWEKVNWKEIFDSTRPKATDDSKK